MSVHDMQYVQAAVNAAEEVARLEAIVSAMRRLGVLTYQGIAITPMAPIPPKATEDEQDAPPKVKHSTIRDLKNGTR